MLICVFFIQLTVSLVNKDSKINFLSVENNHFFAQTYHKNKHYSLLFNSVIESLGTHLRYKIDIFFLYYLEK